MFRHNFDFLAVVLVLGGMAVIQNAPRIVRERATARMVRFERMAVPEIPRMDEQIHSEIQSVMLQQRTIQVERRAIEKALKRMKVRRVE